MIRVVSICAFLLSCSSEPNKSFQGVQNLVPVQATLESLLDNYVSEYQALDSDSLKTECYSLYWDKVLSIIRDSSRMKLDSFLVTVDTVFQQDWLVTTRFHSRNIEFSYGMVFKDSMDERFTSLYNYMRSFRPGEQIHTNFTIIGASSLDISGSGKRVLTIYGYPSQNQKR